MVGVDEHIMVLLKNNYTKICFISFFTLQKQQEDSVIMLARSQKTANQIKKHGMDRNSRPKKDMELVQLRSDSHTCS
jgi:hypothetical protein